MALTKAVFRKLLAGAKPLLLDGALGTFLIRQTQMKDQILWTSTLNLSHPETVRNVFSSYIEAGAEIITTNTFRTNLAAYEQAGLSSGYAAFVQAGVKPALLARQDHLSVLIAGSNAPAEDCYQAERTLNPTLLKINHELHIDTLIEAGVDFILNETQSHFDEIEIICNYCDKKSLPYIISLFLTEDLRILSGESLREVLNKLMRFDVDAVSFNCISPSVFSTVLEKVDLPTRWGFYLNCGTGNVRDANLVGCIPPADYSVVVKSALPHHPSLVGGCCGSTPEHIRELRSLLDA